MRTSRHSPPPHITIPCNFVFTSVWSLAFLAMGIAGAGLCLQQGLCHPQTSGGRTAAGPEGCWGWGSGPPAATPSAGDTAAVVSSLPSELQKESVTVVESTSFHPLKTLLPGCIIMQMTLENTPK